jgi:hypothetical protein
MTYGPAVRLLRGVSETTRSVQIGAAFAGLLRVWSNERVRAEERAGRCPPRRARSVRPVPRHRVERDQSDGVGAPGHSISGLMPK